MMNPASVNLESANNCWKFNNLEEFILESTAILPLFFGGFTFSKADSVSSQVIISTSISLMPESMAANFSSLGTISFGNSFSCKTRQVNRSRFFDL